MFNPGERVTVYEDGNKYTATILYEDDDKLGNTWVYINPDVEHPYTDEHGQLALMKKHVTITPL